MHHYLFLIIVLGCESTILFRTLHFLLLTPCSSTWQYVRNVLTYCVITYSSSTQVKGTFDKTSNFFVLVNIRTSVICHISV